MPETKVITLLTDFGQRDGFVGVMKGVILGIAPTVRIVDIGHEIEPHDVDAGAFVLRSAYRFFPPDSIHVVVIDPGVGSTRRVLAVKASNQVFLAPDNGVLKYIWRECPDAEVRAVEQSSLFLPKVSQTFHGRDIFAPVAAHLARGLPVEEVGPLISDFQYGEVPAPKFEAHCIAASVIYIDRFGNLITNISEEAAGQLHPTELEIRGRRWPLRGLSASYAEGSPGEPLVLIGSSGFLEIAINSGRAADVLGLRVGGQVRMKTRGS